MKLLDIFVVSQASQHSNICTRSSFTTLKSRVPSLCGRCVNKRHGNIPIYNKATSVISQQKNAMAFSLMTRVSVSRESHWNMYCLKKNMTSRLTLENLLNNCFRRRGMARKQTWTIKILLADIGVFAWGWGLCLKAMCRGSYWWNQNRCSRNLLTELASSQGANLNHNLMETRPARWNA